MKITILIVGGFLSFNSSIEIMKSLYGCDPEIWSIQKEMDVINLELGNQMKSDDSDLGKDDASFEGGDNQS